MSTFLHQQVLWGHEICPLQEKTALMRHVGWKSTWKSDFLEEVRPNHSGPVPTASLSRSTAGYFSAFEPTEYLVITSLSACLCRLLAVLIKKKNTLFLVEKNAACRLKMKTKRGICKPSYKPRAKS